MHMTFILISVVNRADIGTRNLRKEDRLGKIKEIIDIFDNNNSCLLILYYGRCSFKQYMPSKPPKYDLKYWASDVNSSFSLKSEIYEGKNESKNNAKNIGENLVISLAEPFFNKVARSSTFFSSDKLAYF